MGALLFVLLIVIGTAILINSYMKKSSIEFNESLDDVQSFLETNGGNHLSDFLKHN